MGSSIFAKLRMGSSISSVERTVYLRKVESKTKARSASYQPDPRSDPNTAELLMPWHMNPLRLSRLNHRQWAVRRDEVVSRVRTHVPNSTARRAQEGFPVEHTSLMPLDEPDWWSSSCWWRRTDGLAWAAARKYLSMCGMRDSHGAVLEPRRWTQSCQCRLCSDCKAEGCTTQPSGKEIVADVHILTLDFYGVFPWCGSHTTSHTRKIENNRKQRIWYNTKYEL